MPNTISAADAYKNFAAFVNANIKSGDAIAAANSQGKIYAKGGGDFVGNIFRSAAERDANNKVRSLFVDTICKMCGVGTVERLPPSVKAAMQLEDMGKGKPLTARRICAVMKEVNVFRTTVAKAKTAAANAQAAAAKAQDVAANAMVGKLRGQGCLISLDYAKSLLVKCGGDRLAIDFLAKHPEVIFTPSFGSAMVQNTPQGQLAMFLDNVADLRKAANGDERIVHAGFKFLEENLSTPGIFTGLFSEMVRDAGSINLDSLKAFSNPGASVEKRHMALVQLGNSIGAASGNVAGRFAARAQVFGGPLRQVNGQSIQSFLAVAAFSRLDGETCGKVAKQFASPETQQLMGMYYHLGYEASHSFVTDKPDFVPKAGDDFNGRALLAKPTNPGSRPDSQAVVISRLMFKEGPTNAPMFGAVESLLKMSFSLETAARQRSGATGAGATLGDRFVSPSSPRTAHPVKASYGSMSADAQYAVKRTFVMRAHDMVVTDKLPEFDTVRRSISTKLGQTI